MTGTQASFQRILSAGAKVMMMNSRRFTRGCARFGPPFATLLRAWRVSVVRHQAAKGYLGWGGELAETIRVQRCGPGRHTASEDAERFVKMFARRMTAMMGAGDTAEGDAKVSHLHSPVAKSSACRGQRVTCWPPPIS